ncbi:transposase, partial [Elusimicrobiota bacterium]
IKKYGKVRGRQRYQCLSCKRQFIPKRDRSAFYQKLWGEYVWHKQTLGQLAVKYSHTKQWVQRQLDKALVLRSEPTGQRIIAVTDTTFFGRQYGILVVRCPRIRKNIHFHEVRSETPEEYLKARQTLERQGYTIEAVVVDGKRGVFRIFSDIPVQLCHFHQMAAVRRYLTSRPNLEAGKELRALTLSLPTVTETTFSDLLATWFDKWKDFLKERTYSEDGKHWQYTHRRIRSAYRSLATHLPYLFTYQKHPELGMPNTTNSLDGYFSKLKQLLNAHRGLIIKRRYKIIQEILKN